MIMTSFPTENEILSVEKKKKKEKVFLLQTMGYILFSNIQTHYCLIIVYQTFDISEFKFHDSALLLLNGFE